MDLPEEAARFTVELLRLMIERFWNDYEKRKEERQSILREKSKETSMYINDIHNKLNDIIFKPLRYNLLAESKGFYFLPLLIFDRLNISNEDLYDEGLNHIKSDIPNFINDFKWLKKESSDYNNDLKDFETRKIEELLSQYFERNGFDIINNPIIPQKDDTVIVTRDLKEILKPLWLTKGYTFDIKYKDNCFVINNKVTIAKISQNREKEFEECFKNLENNEEIIREYFNLIDLYNNIIAASQKLSKEIGEEIVKKIDLNIYKKDCEICNNLINQK